MIESALTKIKLRFFQVPDSKIKRFAIWVYGNWMNWYGPVQTWILYWVLHRKIERNHKKVLTRLKSQKTIRVLFLIKENAKWGWDSLYQAFEEDPLFEPVVAVIFFGLPKTPNELQKRSFAENYRFFQSLGLRVVKAYDEDKNEFVDLRKFSPDIVFYEPPWHLPKIQDIPEVSKFALTCYTPYGLNLEKNTVRYQQFFIQIVWRYFAECDLSKEDICRHLLLLNRGRNVVSSGYPKLDYFLNKPASDDARWIYSRAQYPEKKRIIFAPHWSFSFLRFATFDWSGSFLLNYAKEHPETQWVFKPHPRLMNTLLTERSWDEARAEKSFSDWNRLPNGTVVDQGNYLDLFATSDALITDSVSFLGEYLYTGKPIIHLVRRDSIGYNVVGEKLVKHYYKAYDEKSLKDIIDRVVLNSRVTSFRAWERRRLGESYSEL